MPSQLRIKDVISGRFFKLSIFFITCLAIIFRYWTLGKITIYGFDEQLYGFFVRTLGEQGIGGLRSIIQQYSTNDILQNGSLPFRIFPIAIGFLFCEIYKTYSLYNLVLVSYLAGIGVVVIGFILSKEWFNNKIALLISLLLIISPISIALSRRALIDSTFILIVAGSMLFYHYCWVKNKNIYYSIFGIFLLFGLLTKEYMILLYPGFFLAGLYYNKKMFCSFNKKILLPFILAPIAYFIVCILLIQDVRAYFNIYIDWIRLQNQIAYVTKYQQGPWFRYIIDFLLLSPLTYLLSIIGLVSFHNDKYNKDGKNLAIIYVLSCLVIFSILPSKNIRLVAFLDLPLRMLSVLGMISISNLIKKPVYRYSVISVLILLVLTIDIYQFHKIFITANVYDPVTVSLIKANGFMQ